MSQVINGTGRSRSQECYLQGAVSLILMYTVAACPCYFIVVEPAPVAHSVALARWSAVQIRARVRVFFYFLI